MKKSRSLFLSRLLALLTHEVQTVSAKKASKPSDHTYSRRRFLQDTTKGALGLGMLMATPSLLQSCSDSSNNSNSSDEQHALLDVAILGGGMAGLNCANHLLGSTLTFKVFEGSKRMGGRILTHYNDAMGLGIYPEFGGDFIDSNHEDMLKLAEEFAIERIDLEEECKRLNLVKDVYYFEGRSISEKEIIKEFKKIAKKISLDIAALGEEYTTERAVELDQTALSEYFDSLRCATWLKQLLTSAYLAEYGLDCAQQSTLNFLSMIDTHTDAGFRVFGDSDERFRLKGGNSKLIEKLADKIGEERIAREHLVEAITEQEDGSYLIEFRNKPNVYARQIVCTIPFTILRGVQLKLKNMSAAKQQCIAELGYGNNTKLILGYEGMPWMEEPNRAMGYLFHPDIVNGWDASQNRSEGNTHGAYVCFFGGALSESLNQQSFKNKMSPPSHVWKNELPQTVVDGFVTQLDAIFVNSKSKFKSKHVFANWIDFPFSRGSYSCYKKGQWTSISGLEMEPVGRFYFAGEHCSSDFQGFMNGAAETGRRVAEQIRHPVEVSEPVADTLKKDTTGSK